MEHSRKKGSILVSACLLGVNCRYDGSGKRDEQVTALMERFNLNLIPVCPEQLGGLATPRPQAECIRGEAGQDEEGVALVRVVTRLGTDVTNQYQKGAEETLRLAKLYGCQAALLKERSPSCGHGEIYDGTFTGKLVKGDGITASLLLKNGINVFGESRVVELYQAAKDGKRGKADE